MKVLLTGGTGFLGRYVQAALAARGIETVVVGRAAGAIVDLLDGRAIDAVVAQVRATHLLHLAWYVEHGKYWESPLNLRWVDSSVRLAEAFCRAGGEKVVVAGTCFEYDRTDKPMHEATTALSPDTLYGVAKDATRRLVTAVCKQANVPYAWGRIFLPYGAGESPQRLIPSLAAAFAGRRGPFGVNASAIRDFVHAKDVAEGLMALMQPEARGIYNIGTGRGVRIEDVVREIAGLLHANPDSILSRESARPHEPMSVVADAGKLRALGWQPRCSLSEGLRQAMADFLPSRGAA